MSTKTAAPIQQHLSCSFCFKNKTEVNLLIAGPPLGDTGIYICNACVYRCNEIIKAKNSSPDREGN